MFAQACRIGMALAALGAISGRAAAQTKTFEVEKNVTFTHVDEDDGTRSKATLGRNFAWDRMFNPGKGEEDGPTEIEFGVSASALSLDPDADDTDANPMTVSQQRASAVTTITVGQATGTSNASVDANLKIELAWPCALAEIDPGGEATGSGFIEVFNGTRTINDVTINGIHFFAGSKIKPRKALQALPKYAKVRDPLALRLVGQSLGEVIEADILRVDLEMRGDAWVGWNDVDRLELTIAEIGEVFALLDGETLVPWATDYTGTARLENGVLTATGVYLPPSGVLTDFWDLVTSGTIPGYVVQATLKSGVIDFDGKAFPPVTTNDTFDVWTSHSLDVTLADLGTRINEVRGSQPGADVDEYLELRGFPYDALDRLVYLVIGDGPGGSGVIEEALDLSGFQLNENGYFVVAESLAFGTPDWLRPLNFENSDNVTHLLVRDFTGQLGDDLDLDDDCGLDIKPWSAVLDSVALIEEQNPPTQTECHYAPVTVGPDGTFQPGHAFRCGESWVQGRFEILGGQDTPGAGNPSFFLSGDPVAGSLVHFTASYPYLDAQRIQVLLSCSGTDGIPLPGGLELPLTFDVCTALSLNLAPALTSIIGADGLAETPTILFPAVSPGLRVWAAAVAIDSPPAFTGVLGPMSFVTE